MKFDKKLHGAMLMLVSSLFLFACNKENKTYPPANFNYNLLTAYKWLLTPAPRTFYFWEDRSGIRYKVGQVVIDTTIHIYNDDLSYTDIGISHEIFLRDSIPYTGPYLPDYTPGGNTHNYQGTYSINEADSTVSKIITISGVTYGPTVYKIRLLTNDSLILWNPFVSERHYYAVAR